jgi:hypothetical protein
MQEVIGSNPLIFTKRTSKEVLFYFNIKTGVRSIYFFQRKICIFYNYKSQPLLNKVAGICQ